MTQSKSLRRVFTAALTALSLAAAVMTAVPVSAQTTEVTVTNPAKTSACTLYVNGSKKTSKPYYQGSTLMLPLRAIVELSAGWKYAYGSGTSVFGAFTGTEFSVTVGKNAYKYGGKTHTMDYAPAYVDDRVYVPWQYFEFALGFKVNISADGRIDVNTKTPNNAGVLRLMVNGKYVSGTPYVDGSIYMLPLRPVVTALGYSYDYSNDMKFSVFSAKGINTHIFWGVNSYPVDNKYVSLSVAPVLKNGTLYVPLSYITQALKCKVTQSGNVIKVSR
ncbi:MAG: stalk domain-containing protein [Christensenellales bacterium]|jgi:hypothetical protein